MSKIANISSYKLRKLRRDARAILRDGKENIPVGTGELGTSCIHQIIGDDVHEMYHIEFFGPDALLYAELYQILRPSVILNLIHPINNPGNNLDESITLDFTLETIKKVRATSKLRLAIVDGLPSVFDDSAKEIARWDYSHGFDGDHIAMAKFYAYKDPATMLAILEHARYLCLRHMIFCDEGLRRDAETAAQDFKRWQEKEEGLAPLDQGCW